MVHESTYIEGDKTLANNYHHSHIEDVFALMQKANVKHSLVTHISNRYTLEEVEAIYNDLLQGDTLPSFQFVNDFDSYQI